MRTLVVAVFIYCLAGVASGESLRVGLSPDFEPMVFKQGGQLVGVDVDNARAVGKILRRDVRFVEMPQSEYINALNEKKVDVVMSGFSVTDERAARVAFVEPYMQVGQMAVILASQAARLARPRALFGKGIRLGVEPGTTGQEHVLANYPLAAVSVHADPDAAFAALRSGQIDAYIHDAPTSWRLANSRENRDLLSLYRPLTRENLAWAVRRDNTRLLNELNDALAEMRASGRLGAIQNYWIPVTVQVR